MTPERKLAVTHADHPLNEPYDESYNSPMYRQFYNRLDDAVAAFTEQINDFLDAGCIQLWDLNHNNNSWTEIGMIYL